MERRLTAILAADVVGYSRLMGANEAGTLTALKTHRKELVDGMIAQHQGRIVKLTGDGMLVEFPSVVNAVACAVKIQQEMRARNADVPEDRRIEFRIGVHLGDVIVEDNDIFGDGVNVAARIENIARPGGVAVSGSVRDNVGNRLDLTFEDTGEHTLKNIERPVRVYNVSLGAPVPAKPAAREKPSIAVLPFNNMSGDPEQEYFSDGITEDIITELSRFKTLLVMARNSSFVYKGKAVDIGKVARDLGVSHVLEGSVRRVGNRVRISAQLINTGDGAHIWAERYDRELADIFAVQDEVTLSIVGRLTLGLEDEALEGAKRKRPENLLAYDHWLRGKRLLWATGQKNLDAKRHFEAAASVDPGFSRAYSGLAVVYQLEALDFPTPEDFKLAYDNAHRCAARALDLDEADYQAHMAAAWPCLYRGDYNGMKKHIEWALQLNPNDADTLANAAYLLAMYGDATEAVHCAEKAMVLNPRYPDWYAAFRSAALFTARRYEEAMTYRFHAPDVFVDSVFCGAALLAYMGRLEDARQWADKAVARLASRPGGALIATRGCVQILLDNNPWRRKEDLDHFAEGLRKAGVPG